MQQVVEYNPGYTNPYSEAYEDALIDHGLQFTANTLQSLGFDTEDDLHAAIERAMHVCAMSGMSVREHFRCVYVSNEDDHTLCRDWKLSKLAYTLVLLNGKPDNPMVGRMQLEVARRYATGA